jgi:predicted phosphodiesterase
MRLVVISETHGLHNRIKELPDGDVLIHAGDL